LGTKETPFKVKMVPGNLSGLFPKNPSQGKNFVGNFSLGRIGLVLNGNPPGVLKSQKGVGFPQGQNPNLNPVEKPATKV